MGILDKANNKKRDESEVKKVVSNETNKSNLNLTTDELEFMIRMIGNSNFKGNNLMFIYDLVKKLQDEYLKKSGGSK